MPKEVKLALLAGLPFGAAAALILNWSSLFPVPPEKLVEVVWKHECSCAAGWMQRLRAEGFVVRDFELDDLSRSRQQWRVPASVTGCHPASYLGYFVDGHITAAALRRLARERPKAIDLQQVDTVSTDSDGQPKVIGSQLMLVDADGQTRPWP